MQPLITAAQEGGENEESPTNSSKSQSLKQLLESTFKDEKTVNYIYSKLVEMELDISELILTETNDLNELCQDMKLKGATKIKFKALIQKQKQLKLLNTIRPKQIITISSNEQKEINKIEISLKQNNDLHHLLETHFNDIEQHSITITSLINQTFNNVFKQLKKRQKSLNNTIAQWKLDKLEEINKEISEISENSQSLKQLQEEINNLLTKDKCVINERENKIKQITQKFFENNKYYKIFNDIKLLQIYLDNNTKISNIIFNDKIINNLNTFGVINDKNNIKYTIPSIVLSNIIEKDKNNKGYKLDIEWIINNKQQNDNNINYFIYFMECNNANNDYDEKKEYEINNKNENWQMINNTKIKTICKNKNKNIMSSNINMDFSYDKIYKFKVQCMVNNPLNIKVISNVKPFVCNNIVNFDLKKEQNIELTVHSHRGHHGSYKPDNLFLSDDSYYCSKKGVLKDDWIIFANKRKGKYYPTKVDIRGGNANTSTKEFNLCIGDSNTNKWIKLNEKPFVAKKKEGFQSFPFDICNNNNMNNDINRKWMKIQKNEFIQYKLQILNNYGNGTYVGLYECKLFGVEYN